MKRVLYTLLFGIALFFVSFSPAKAEHSFLLIPVSLFFEADSTDKDTIDLKFKIQDNYNPFGSPNADQASWSLGTPSNIQSQVVYDPETGEYTFKQTIGDSPYNFRNPSIMDFEEYKNYTFQQADKNFWSEKAKLSSKGGDEEDESGSGFRPQLKIENEAFDRIFGGNTVDIRPSGSAELLFGVNISRTDNPAVPENNRRVPTFDFDQRIQLNAIGNIGEKVKLNFNYNTEATFNFENKAKLGYTGKEDEIIQRIEAGNVSMPSNGTLITGNQSLMGIKTKLKFGKLDVTTVISQQQGKKTEINVQGGAQVQEFEIKGDNYEQNKHFFLSHYFRNNYEKALKNPPFINSQFLITRVEVWVTNTRLETEDTRNIVGFQDLGEPNGSNMNNPIWIKSKTNVPADNSANTLYEQIENDNSVRNFNTLTGALNAKNLKARIDYQKVELARKLTEQEYTFHPQLGYVSLNQELQLNQVLAVAFQYTYRGETYQVGEFSTDFNQPGQTLFLKMLKSTELITTVPMWDLMMKNIYSLNAFQVSRDKFMLNVWYNNQETGVEIPFIPEGNVSNTPLIQVLGLDKLNINNIAGPDGIFDFIANPKITIVPDKGKIIFPVLEPFGKTLRDSITDPLIANKYAFDSLYTTTRALAQVNFPQKNRFLIKGTYQSSVTSEIRLNAINVPEGSVQVTAGGRTLTETTDYIVDYTLGTVRIINQGILESGVPIKVSLESQEMFAIQNKSLIGSRFDYKFADNFTLGGTIMRLTERPITQKVNIGLEPIANTVIGVDGKYSTESLFLTKLVDKIPLIDTKEKSTLSISGEAATLLPGHSRAVGKTGTSYIDDFEGSQAQIDLRQFANWHLASTPQGQPAEFPEGNLINNIAYGFNRAKLAWYVIDPLFFRNNSITPDHIKQDAELQSNHFMREVFETEVFPNKNVPVGVPANISMFDLAYYPTERGPYNYDVDGVGPDGQKYAAGVNPDGSLKDPASRWGGVMRRIDQNDFDAANVEFIQFWMMDPFNEDYPYDNTDGELIFNLGKISEDVLRDEIKTFENGLPKTEEEASDLTPDTISTWGRVPRQGLQAIVNAFDNDEAARPYQDVGFDGLRDEEERRFFEEVFLNKFDPSTPAYQQALEDPSSDNYHYYRGDDYDNELADVLLRYKYYNGLEGNSPTSAQYSAQNAAGYPTSASTLPHIEDINRDNNMDEIESYYQYRVKISPDDINPNNIGNNFITDVLETTARTKNGENRRIRWYQFKIPIRNEQTRERIGNITDLRSVQYMRMLMKDFENPVFLRFARLELIRGEWRKFTDNLQENGTYFADDADATFNISAVNLEENGDRSPVNYVLPPGIAREINIGTQNLQQLNEQALSVQVCDLKDGKSVAAFRNLNMDFISYNRLQMFVHAEAAQNQLLNDGDLRAFVRIGTDFENNYYEYEIPLKITEPGDYNPDLQAEQEKVWPTENNIDINFQDFVNLKLQRNSEILNGAANVSTYQVYSLDSGEVNYRVVGNPNLNDVRTIMLGIKNPRGDGNLLDDKLAKCAEVWFNELRLTDFDDQAGYAAVGRVTSQLADFATVSLAGSISTPGWGSIEKKVSERQRETKTTVDAAANVELGKFFPEKAKVKIPMYVGYSQNASNPQFNPLEPDISTKQIRQSDVLSNEQKAEIRQNAKNVTERTSINFTNVRKEKTDPSKPAMPYDINNFTLSYAYSNVTIRDINTVQNNTREYRGGLTYNYAPRVKPVTPFKNFKPVQKNKYLQIIKDFNIYPLPKQISFNTDMNRSYNVIQTRNNIQGFDFDLPEFYNKTFNWNRNFNFRYDLSKSLKFDYSSNNKSLVEEPNGRVDRAYKDEYQEFRSEVIRSISQLGTPLNYTHNTNINYTLPLNKFPLTDWINVTAKYASSYSWQRAAFAIDTLGNTIQNSRQININGTLNFNSLYNKSKFIKTISRPSRTQRPTRVSRVSKTNAENEEDGEGEGKKKDKKKENSKKQRLKEKADFEKRVEKIEKTWEDKTEEQIKADKLMLKKELKQKRKKWRNMWLEDNKGYIKPPVDLVTAAKNASFNYTRNQGVMLPGYNREVLISGFDNNFSAPGFGFLFGQQNNFGADSLDFAAYAANKGWLVQRESLNELYSQTYTENFNARATIEPLKGLRIALNATWQKALNNTEFYRWGYDKFAMDSMYVRDSPQTMGNFSTTINTFRTAFVRDRDDFTSPLFEQFLANREVISQRLAAANPLSNGVHELNTAYADGYGEVSPDVLIPAFIAAYTGTSANEQSLNPLKAIPLPNWRVTYNGLSSLDVIKKHFKSVTLNHSYTSTYNIASFSNNMVFEDRDGDGFTNIRDINSSFVSPYNYNVVVISEQFGPLINVDVATKNNIQARFEIRKGRDIALSMANAQITEVKSNEIVVGTGYIIPKVKWPFKTAKPIESPLNMRLDVSIRDNKTIIRKILEDINQPSQGQTVVTVKFTADYKMNNSLTLRLYYDRVANRPVVPSAFYTANTNAGISVRFTLNP